MPWTVKKKRPILVPYEWVPQFVPHTSYVLLLALSFPVHLVLVHFGGGLGTYSPRKWALVTTTSSLLSPVAYSCPPGACAEVLAQQRAAITRLLQVLEDLDQAHEEFQKRGQGQAAL